MNMEERRKQLRKQGKDTRYLYASGRLAMLEKEAKITSSIPFSRLDEDDPDKFRHAVQILTMKLFADLERKRRQLEQKMSDEAAKKRQAELELEERKNMEKEFAKNWEESRYTRTV